MTDEDRITGRTSNVRQLFTGRRYTIDTYQREYSWETKHVEDLIQDLSQRFLGQWGPLHERRDVQHYQSYFLGPIITTASERINLIDGQQRLTTLTLLLIFLRRLQEGREDGVADLGSLVYSQLYGEEAFTLDIGDRRRGMTAVLRGQELDPRKASPSERTLMARYRDIEETFPETLRGEALPFFIDWLLGRVVVVEIVTHDAATGQEIFETMNDRGQRLTSLDMLKSYLVGRARRYAGDVNESWRANLASPPQPDPHRPGRPAKVRMVAGFLDIFVARSMLSYQDFRQAAVWRRILALSRVLRRLDRPEIGARLAAELDALGVDAGSSEAFGLRQRNRAHVKYLL